MAKKGGRGKSKALQAGAKAKKAAGAGAPAKAGKRKGFGKAPPRLSKGELDRLTRRLSDPDTLQAEFNALLLQVERGQALLSLRLPHDAVIARCREAPLDDPEARAAADADRMQRLIELAQPLVTNELRAEVERVFERELSQGGSVRERMPLLVGRFLTNADAERTRGVNPLFGVLFRVSAAEAPFRAWVEARLAEGPAAPAIVGELAREGKLHEAFERWLGETETLTAIERALPGYALGDAAQLVVATAPLEPVALPLETALWSIIEHARADRRRAALGVAAGAPDDDAESQRMLARALAKDAPLAVGAYRMLLGVQLQVALDHIGRARAEDATAAAGAARLAGWLAASIVALDLNPIDHHFGLARSYLETPGFALTELESSEDPDELEAASQALGAPLDPNGYLVFARYLLDAGREAGLAARLLEVALELGADQAEATPLIERAIAARAGSSAAATSAAIAALAAGSGTAAEENSPA